MPQCTLRLTDFVLKASQLYNRMVTQGGNKANTLRQIETAFKEYPELFQTYFKKYDEIMNKIIMY